MADEPKGVTDRELEHAKGRHEEDFVDLTGDSPMSNQEEIDTSRLFEYDLTEDTLNPDKNGKTDRRFSLPIFRGFLTIYRQTSISLDAKRTDNTSIAQTTRIVSRRTTIVLARKETQRGKRSPGLT